MSSQPTGWQTPKTNWQSADVPLPSDFNRIEGDIQAIEDGLRTLDPSQAPSGNSGSLRQFLDWFANRIRAITGATNWYDAPATTLAATKSHIDATSGIHGATSSATANRIIIRDSAGRAKVAAPSASDDIARKAEVDAVSSALNTHMDATSGVHGATSSATANRLIIRDSNGRASVADPTSSSHIATKGYVDGTVSSHANATSVHGATSSATANRLVIRDGSGRAQFVDPSSAQDAATKGYVDALLGTPMAAGTNFVVQVVDTTANSSVTTYPNWQDSIRNTENRGNNVAVRILLPGTVRCALEHRTSAADSAQRSYVRVLKNGSVVQEWNTNSYSYVARSVDVNVSPGDVITFQQRSSSSNESSQWRNLRVMTAAPTLGIQRIV